MESRREMYGAAIRLAIALSVVSAMLAYALASIGAAPRSVIVLAVIVIGFGASWAQSGRHAMANPPVRRCTVPVRHPLP